MKKNVGLHLAEVESAVRNLYFGSVTGPLLFGPRHEISNNVVCATNNASEHLLVA